jgi:hypothetical protein
LFVVRQPPHLPLLLKFCGLLVSAPALPILISIK